MDDAALTLSDPVDLAGNERDDKLASRRVAEMVERHFDFVWRVLRRLGVPERDTDDAAQKCFLVAARKLDVRRSGEEKAFLFQIAMRVASAAKRERFRQREAGDDALDVIVDPKPGPEVELQHAQARLLLDEVLDRMPSELRVVFVLFELEGFRAPEIASLVSVPLGTATSRIRRARERFETEARRVKARLDRGALR